MDCRRRLRQRHRTRVHALGRHHRHDDLLRRPARRRARRADALGRRRCVPEAARGDRHRQAAAYRRLPAADDDAGARGAVGPGAVPRRRARRGLPRQPVQRAVQHRPGDAAHRDRERIDLPHRGSAVRDGNRAGLASDRRAAGCRRQPDRDRDRRLVHQGLSAVPGRQARSGRRHLPDPEGRRAGR